RLVRIFSADVAVFERKRFREPSHEPTKAAHLNAYLALVGGEHELHDLDGVPHVVDIPACDVVITLDADSMLLPEYAARLVYALQ
ncbi:glycosyltransferase, partial [Staphylococcus aureus]